MKDLARLHREATAELTAGAVALPLGVDRPHSELAGDLVSEDDPAGRRSGDGLDREPTREFHDRGAEPFGLLRPLEHLELLEVARGMFPRGENEVALEECARAAEDVLDDGRSDAHRPSMR